ncbi:hypothetical protein ABZW49_34945 [Nonomuraea wenchangensis]
MLWADRPAFAKVAAAAHPGDVLPGPLSNLHDLAANDATTALLINVITAAGQFQRDLQNELTAEGIAAAEAEGRYRGRPPALIGLLPGRPGPPALIPAGDPAEASH